MHLLHIANKNCNHECTTVNSLYSEVQSFKVLLFGGQLACYFSIGTEDGLMMLVEKPWGIDTTVADVLVLAIVVWTTGCG